MTIYYVCYNTSFKITFMSIMVIVIETCYLINMFLGFFQITFHLIGIGMGGSYLI